MSDLSKIKIYKNILVTGGAGAIGGNLVKKLLDLGVKKIIIIDDLSSGYISNIPRNEKIIFIRGDIVQDAILKKAFKYKIDCVFHLAAHFANQNSIEHPVKDLLTNGVGTLKLLDYAQKNLAKKFIYLSTSCLYKSKIKLSENDTDLKFETPYAISKYIGERYVNFFHEYYGLPTVILRIFNSFGPGERSGLYRNVIPKFFYQAIKKQDLIITGTGAETRNFTFVDDIVRGAILAAIKKAANGHIINLGGSREISVLELAKKINKLTNNHKKIIFKPRRKWDDTLSRKADLRLAKKLLGYKAEISFEGGLGKTHEWILNQIKINKI